MGMIIRLMNVERDYDCDDNAAAVAAANDDDADADGSCNLHTLRGSPSCRTPPLQGALEVSPLQQPHRLLHLVLLLQVLLTANQMMETSAHDPPLSSTYQSALQTDIPF